MLLMTLGGKYCREPHLIDNENEARRGEVTWPQFLQLPCGGVRI